MKDSKAIDAFIAQFKGTEKCKAMVKEAKKAHDQLIASAKSALRLSKEQLMFKSVGDLKKIVELLKIPTNNLIEKVDFAEAIISRSKNEL
jgi:hypothetical protein